jgi:hypothetical protein
MKRAGKEPCRVIGGDAASVFRTGSKLTAPQPHGNLPRLETGEPTAGPFAKLRGAVYTPA